MSKIPQRWDENFTDHVCELQANEWLPFYGNQSSYPKYDST